MNNILVTAKINPDLDGTACTLAYSDLLKQVGNDVDGLVTGYPQSEVKYFINRHKTEIPTRSDEQSDKWSKFVLVDASSMKGMPKAVSSDQVIELIDHRAGEPEKEFPKAKIQNELIGAAATIVVERFIRANKNITPDHAKLLYGAIYHNTLNFIATNATKRDKDAVQYLEKKYQLNTNIIHEMFDFATKEIEKDVALALENDAKEFGTGWKIGAYQLVVWDSRVLNDKSLIQNSVTRLKQKMGSDWSFVNIIDLESKRSTIYSESEGEAILSKVLGVSFSKGWTSLPAVLRKQIMPRVNAAIK